MFDGLIGVQSVDVKTINRMSWHRLCRFIECGAQDRCEVLKLRSTCGLKLFKHVVIINPGMIITRPSVNGQRFGAKLVCLDGSAGCEKRIASVHAKFDKVLGLEFDQEILKKWNMAHPAVGVFNEAKCCVEWVHRSLSKSVVTQATATRLRVSFEFAPLASEPAFR